MMEIFPVDAHALAWFIAQSPRLSQSAAEVLRKGERAEVEILVPTIVLAELLYIAERKKVPVSLAEILNTIASLLRRRKAYRAKVISKDAQIKRVITTVW